MVKNLSTQAIRQAFIAYFTNQGHTAVASSSLVPADDPSLLFANAGMVQFKGTFTGVEKRPYNRAVTIQRCLRAGGKHNDLDNVGYTARHHTFFEMLGNFSFGDYFKREAIQYAWDFLTKVLELPVEKLWVTVHETDDEAAAIWLNEVGVSKDRFSRCGDKDNFWSMGDTGPCGPCTEIFYDHGSAIAGGPPGSPDAEGDRYIEIWNLVFMQYDRDKQGVLHPLPKPSVDTGMGLERIAAVVQHVHSNYEIDVFQYIINAIVQMSPQVDAGNPALKVIADHIRACVFLIADGVRPQNEGRGYVLRRIIRRAIRHGHQLALPEHFFSQLVPFVVDIMGEAYPYILPLQTDITEVLVKEENQFAKTLEMGLRLLQSEIMTLTSKEIPGELAFKLYDTYGFPLDLTQDIAKEQGLTVETKGFDAALLKQRTLSQAASQFTASSNSLSLDDISTFHGYDKQQLTSPIIQVIQDDKKTAYLEEGHSGAIVLQDSPFYAESGGQVGDRGWLTAGDNQFEVKDTQAIGHAIVHYGTVISGQFSLNMSVEARIDQNRRQAIAYNHTATHLLHAALKHLLGDTISQKGSRVDAETTRFDFSYGVSLTEKQIAAVEQFVNQAIRDNFEVQTALMPIEAAKESGAVALFGEKYADTVRVLSIATVSKELCGGTHVKRTGDIGLFKIIAEYGIASGVRRIEFVTGGYALHYIEEQMTSLSSIIASLKATPDNVVSKVNELAFLLKEAQKKETLLQSRIAEKMVEKLLLQVEKIANIPVLIVALDSVDAVLLKPIAEQLKNRLSPALIILYVINEDKLQVIASVHSHYVSSNLSAPLLVKMLCDKGGGQKEWAQGGAILPSDLEKRLEKIKAYIRGC